jgi:hypothetical protein
MPDSLFDGAGLAVPERRTIAPTFQAFMSIFNKIAPYHSFRERFGDFVTLASTAIRKQTLPPRGHP